MTNTHHESEKKHTTNPYDHDCYFKCISWSAVITGGLVGIGLTFLLNLFSTAIGLSVFAATKEGIITLVIGGFLGMLIGVIAALFVSGWIAGYLGRINCSNRQIGALYGFLAWCVTLLTTVTLTTNMNQFVTTYHTSLTSSGSTMITTTMNEPASMNMQKTHVNPKNEMQSTGTVNTEKAHEMGVSLLITFFLFLIGALSSSFGGYYGFKNSNETRNKQHK